MFLQELSLVDYFVFVFILRECCDGGKNVLVTKAEATRSDLIRLKGFHKPKNYVEGREKTKINKNTGVKKALEWLLVARQGPRWWWTVYLCSRVQVASEKHRERRSQKWNGQ